MNVYELRFGNRSAFERAFLDVRSCEYVEDCLVDTRALSLRFRAQGKAGLQLFDRIKREGEPMPGVRDASAREG